MNDPERRSARYTSRGLAADPIPNTFARDEEQLEAVSEAWRTTETILAMIDALCRERGIAWAGLVMPSEIHVGQGWENFSRYLGPGMVRDYAERRLGGLFRRLGVPLVVLLPTFDSHEGTVLPFRGGHLNPAAHELVAQATYETLATSGLLPSNLPLRLKFGDPAARRWMRDGWYQVESTDGDTHVWSEGGLSVIEVPLRAGREIRMQFESQPFVFPGSPDQRISVVVNGMPVAEVPLRPHRAAYSVILPGEALRESTDTVEFRYRYARRPAEVFANSADTRLLGVAWYALEFLEASR